MEPMSATREIAAFDSVELIKAIDGIPAGASGGVLERADDGTAMVEITSMPELNAVERIVAVPLTMLRRTHRAGSVDLSS